MNPMPIVKQRQRNADFLGLKKNIVALLAMVILVGLGEKRAERFLPLYLMALDCNLLFYEYIEKSFVRQGNLNG